MTGEMFSSYSPKAARASERVLLNLKREVASKVQDDGQGGEEANRGFPQSGGARRQVQRSLYGQNNSRTTSKKMFR